MQIQITGHHPFEVSDAMKEKINSKFAKLDHFFNNIIDIHVTLSIEHFEHVAVGNVHLAKGSKGHIAGKARSKDMYDSIDGLIEALKPQLVRHKEKLKSFTPPSHDLEQGAL